MPLELTWQQIALRLLLAGLSSLLIGFNRDEHGRPAGMRTTMLVCLAATLAMVESNLLLSMTGKASNSFIQLDAMRLPLGILTGIGFIGAGAIIRKENAVSGVTTAATLWYTTVLGIVYGSGKLWLGATATVIALFILIVLRGVENYVPRERSGALILTFQDSPLSEEDVRSLIITPTCSIVEWIAEYAPVQNLTYVRAVVRWKASAYKGPQTPSHLAEIRNAFGISTFRWEQ